MRRTVSARLELAISDPAEIALQIAAAAGERVDELFEMQPRRRSGRLARGRRGARRPRASSLEVERGRLAVTYAATVIGQPRRPSAARTSGSSTCARAATRSRTGSPRSRGGSSAASPMPRTSWLPSRPGSDASSPYVAGSSLPTHGAVDTLLGGRGRLSRLRSPRRRVCFAPATCRRGWRPSTRPDYSRWTSTPSPRHSSTEPGVSSTRRCSRHARRSSASRRAGTPPTRRSSP